MTAQKRLFDCLVLLVGAVVWIPCLVACALVIWLTDGRPLFYVSERRVFGRRRLFTAKLRVMRRDAEKIANRKTVPVGETRFLNLPNDSPLYTPVGRFFERWCMTELPQLLHVLKGEMTLVGNRPLPEDVIASLREAYPYAEDRFLSLCGLTGPVQLVGRERITDEDRLRLEIAYSRLVSVSYSIRLDFLVLLYTVLVATRVRKPLTVGEVEQLMRVFASEAFADEPCAA